MATGTIPLARFAASKVFAPTQAKVTPTLTVMSQSKMFTPLPIVGGGGPIPRRKTQTIDIRM
jgi:hypothetical protein